MGNIEELYESNACCFLV